MAYLKPMPGCQASGCKKPAVVQLIDRKNGVHGHFCKNCGSRGLIRLLKQEQVEDGTRPQCDNRGNDLLKTPRRSDTCNLCGHAKHKPGLCLNAASDNDCSCGEV